MTVLTVINPAALELLSSRLAAASAADPRLAEVVERVLLPVRTMQSLGELAVAALGDDPAAAERLQVLIAAAAVPFEVDLAAAQQAAGTSTKMQTNAAKTSSVSGWPSDSLVDLGGVVILGLAALRAGAPLGLGRSLLGSLTGLTLATGPAEALLRWIRLDVAEANLHAYIASFASVNDGRAGLYRAFARQLVIDQIEQARWSCVLAVFGKAGLQQDARQTTGWFAAHVDGLTGLSVDPDGERYRLTGTIPARTTGSTSTTPATSTTTAATTTVQLEVVVVGRRGITPERLVAEVLEWTSDHILVRIPGGLRGGWLGFSSTALVSAANHLRAWLRARWAKPPGHYLSNGVPVELITDLPAIPAPPRVLVSPPPRLVAVTRSGGDDGDDWLVTPGETLRVVVISTPLDQPAWVWLDGSERAPVALEQGRAVLTVPAALVADGARLTVRLADAPTAEARDQLTVGPLRLRRRMQVVLVRPTLVSSDGDDDQVLSQRQADAAIDAAARRSGVLIQRYVLPSLDDDLAVLYGPLHGPADGRLDRVLAALARTAAITIGSEDMLWLAVIPGTQPWQRMLPAAAARAVAVASPSGLADLFQTLATQDPITLGQPQQVMRLVGQVDGFGGIAWQSVRSELRRLPATMVERPATNDLQLRLRTAEKAVVPIAPPATELLATVLDAMGTVTHEQVLPPLAPLAADQLAALVPIPPEASVVEIRRRLLGSAADPVPAPVTVARIVRPDASLHLRVELVDDALVWQVSQDDGLPEVLTLEAALAQPMTLGTAEAKTTESTAVWTILEGWSAGCTTRRVPSWQRHDLRNVTRLRVVADDGWHGVPVVIKGRPPTPTQAIRIRRMPDGRLWADGPGTPSWSVPGAKPGNTRLIRLVVPGQVALRMRAGSRTVRDHLAIAADDAGFFHG